jgi:hypothetical protein
VQRSSSSGHEQVIDAQALVLAKAALAIVPPGEDRLGSGARAQQIDEAVRVLERLERCSAPSA